MSLAKRSVRSAAWTSLTTVVSLPVSFTQSILLARLLPVEYFGIFAGVNSLLVLIATFFEFGFTNALIHRSPETEDEARASQVFFTLRLIFESVSTISLAIFGIIAFSGLRRQALLILVFAMFIYRMTQIPRILLIRRVRAPPSGSHRSVRDARLCGRVRLDRLRLPFDLCPLRFLLSRHSFRYPWLLRL